MKTLIPTDPIEESIFIVRGHKVMVDRHLSELYDVETGALNRAIKRNRDRFPADFMFQLTKGEWENLKCQIGISSWGGDRRALPYVFTEHGVAMLSSVLNSKRAIHMNIAIMRAFGRLRQMALTHKELSQRLTDLERGYLTHDGQIKSIFEALRELLAPPEKTTKVMGFES